MKSILLDTINSPIRKALVTLATQRVLLKIGKPVLNEVTRRLYLEYKCYIPDCHDHPEFLKAILKDLYGASQSVIEESIRNNLEEFSHQKPIEKFIAVIGG